MIFNTNNNKQKARKALKSVSLIQYATHQTNKIEDIIKIVTYNFSPEQFLTLHSVCPKLQTLKLSVENSVEQISKFVNLKQLQILITSIDYDFQYFYRMKNLRSLTIKIAIIGVNDFTRIADDLPKLQQFGFQCARGFPKKALICLKPLHLRKLGLFKMKILENVMNQIVETFPQLLILSLQKSTLQNPKDLKEIQQLKKLKNITFNQLQQQQLQMVSELVLPQLQQLTIDHINIRSQHLSKIFTNSSKINGLHLQFCEITDEQLKTITQQIKDIQKITLIQSLTFTPKGLETFFNKFQNISELNIKLNHTSIDQIKSIFKLLQLKKICLAFTTNVIRDKYLIGFKRLKQLKQVTILGILSLQLSMMFLKNMKELKWIKFQNMLVQQNCRQVTRCWSRTNLGYIEYY